MNQTRFYAVGFNEHAQTQRRSNLLNAGAAPRPQWIIAIQNFDGSSFLLSVPLDDWDRGDKVLARAREQLCKVSHQKFHEWCLSMIVTKTVVGTAKVKRIMNSNLDPHVRYRVSLQDHEHDPLLTEIFHKSIHLSHNDPTFPFNPTTIDDCPGRKIIVVGRVLDRLKIARLLISLLLISPVLGTVVAMFTHHAGVGVAVSAGVGVTVSAAGFGLASFLQALATWFDA